MIDGRVWFLLIVWCIVGVIWTETPYLIGHILPSNRNRKHLLGIKLGRTLLNQQPNYHQSVALFEPRIYKNLRSSGPRAPS
jgi:hypothetical protein